MYNRYLNAAYGDRPAPTQSVHTSPPPQAETPPSYQHTAPPPKSEGGGLFSGLSEALTGRLQGLHFDMDTIIILIAVYFLLADSDDFDTDLLILIGVMFVLGF